MGKKIKKEDIKKSQGAMLIWTSIILVTVMAIVGGVVWREQSGEQIQPIPPPKPQSQSQSQDEISMAEIQTSKGTIKVSLENKKMPITVGNFTKLVNSGFYNGLNFHRVEDWVIQGGDPNGNGSGGSDETITLETSPDLKNIRGALAMARSTDPNSASSQFYILKSDASWLDGQYAVFGNVITGMELVDKMEIGDKILSIKIVK